VFGRRKLSRSRKDNKSAKSQAGQKRAVCLSQLWLQGCRSVDKSRAAPWCPGSRNLSLAASGSMGSLLGAAVRRLLGLTIRPLTAPHQGSARALRAAFISSKPFRVASKCVRLRTGTRRPLNVSRRGLRYAQAACQRACAQRNRRVSPRRIRPRAEAHHGHDRHAAAARHGWDAEGAATREGGDDDRGGDHQTAVRAPGDARWDLALLSRGERGAFGQGQGNSGEVSPREPAPRTTYAPCGLRSPRNRYLRTRLTLLKVSGR
jgi:hypothetical protein